jgi:hypothetical protein
MITITIMTILATIQSSINKLVPKTAYLKMIDIWLIYSFNINILIMAFHIKLDAAIPRDHGETKRRSKVVIKCFEREIAGDEEFVGGGL